MRIAVQEINRDGLVFSKKRFYQMQFDCIKKYNVNMAKLFKLGFVDNSSYFDEESFWGSFFEEYPNLVSFFSSSLTGEINLTPLMIDFVCRGIKDASTKEVLLCVKSVIEAKEVINIINEIYPKIKFKKKSDEVRAVGKLYVSGQGITCSGSMHLDNPILMNSFVLAEDETLECFDYSPYLMMTALQSIGESSYIDGDSSLLLGSDFSIADDYKYISLILTGEIKGTGILADKLFSHIESYYRNYYESNTTAMDCISYWEKLYIDMTGQFDSKIESWRHCLDDSKRAFYADSLHVYYAVRNLDKTKDCVISSSDFFSGDFLIDNIGANSICLVSRLEGMCGEFISKERAESLGYITYGMPILLKSVKGKLGCGFINEEYYYPVYNVKKSSGADIYPKLTIESFRCKDYSEVLSALDLTENNLQDEVYKVIKYRYQSNQLGFNEMVVVLFKALICADCDINYHFKVEDLDMFYSACTEASLLYIILGVFDIGRT